MKKIVCYILVLFLLFQGNTALVYAEEYNTSDECVTQDEIDSNPLMYNIDAQKRIAVFLDYMDSEWVIKKREIYIAKDNESKNDKDSAEKKIISYMDWDTMIKNAQTMKKERKNQIGKTYTVGEAKYKIISYNKARRIQDLSKKKSVVIPDTIKIGKNTYMVSELSNKAFNKAVTKIVLGKYVQLSRSDVLSYVPNLKALESKSQYACYQVDTGLYGHTVDTAWTMTMYDMKKVGKPVKTGAIVVPDGINKGIEEYAQKYQGKIKDNLEGYTFTSAEMFTFSASQCENIITLGKKCTAKIDGFNYKEYDYYYTNSWNGGIIELPKKVTDYVSLDAVSGKETKYTTKGAWAFKTGTYYIWYPRKDGSYTKQVRATYLDGYFNKHYSEDLKISSPLHIDYCTVLRLMYKYRTSNIKINWESVNLHEMRRDVLSHTIIGFDFGVDIDIYTSDWHKIKKNTYVNISADNYPSDLSTITIKECSQ